MINLAEEERKAKGGDGIASYVMGHSYTSGDNGVKVSISKAIEWYEYGSKLENNILCLFMLGIYYKIGHLVERDDAKAQCYFEKSFSVIEKNAHDGEEYSRRCLIAYYNLVENDSKEGLGWKTKIAEEGNAFAQLSLATHYHYGQGVEIDRKKSFYWYSQAAEQGDTASQFQLAMCYANNEGVTRDYTKAVYWCTKAAEKGHGFAQFILGKFYLNGNGVTQDFEKGEYWYTKAAEQGWRVKSAISKCKRLAKDTDEAEKGNMSLQYRLGKTYYEGDGDIIRQDYYKAAYWFAKAAEQGHAKAKSMLDVLHVRKAIELVHTLTFRGRIQK
jgi:TPR repeat protein